MKRTILYNNKDIELVEEDGEYVLVKHAPKVKITTRSSNSDAKVLQSKNTVKSYLADCHMVYKVFDCPSINGKLLIFTTDGYDLRHCCGGHELTGRYLDEFMDIAEKEFNVKSYLYGEMREAPESGFILMSMNKHFLDEELEARKKTKVPLKEFIDFIAPQRERVRNGMVELSVPFNDFITKLGKNP